MTQDATTSTRAASPDWLENIEPDPWWTDGADRALALLAATGSPFTVDALRDEPYCLPDPPHPNAWGGLLARARRRGLIRPIGYTISTRPSRHGSIVRVWTGGRDQ